MTFDLQPYLVYKNSGVSWLGQVPEHWEVLPGRACFCEKKQPNVALQETTILSLSYGQIVIKSSEKLHGLVPSSFETYQIVDPLNIIIRPTDLQNDHNSLRFGLSRYRGIITSAYLCFLARKCLVPEYGYLLLHSYDLMKIFYGLGSGLRQNLDWADFKHLPCAVPPLSEQTSIVRFLDHADRRIRRYIRAKQKLIALLEEQKQAIIHQAVTGQIDVRTGQHYPAYKPSGVEWLGDVPAHWEMGPLKRFVARRSGAIKAGPFGSQLRADEMMDKEVKVYTQRNVIDRDLEGGTNYISNQKFEDLRAFEVFPGDVLVTTRGTIGRTVLVSEDCERGVLHPCLIRIQPDQGHLVAEFLMSLIQDSQLLPQQLAFLSNATTIAVIYSGTLANIVVPVPPLSEQIAIACFLACASVDMVSVKDRIRREIHLLQEYRTRLIADVVTGKFDVREAAAALPEVNPLAKEDDPDDTFGTSVDSANDELDFALEGAEA